MRIFSGCYTASITPMKKNFEIDYEGLERLVEFQVEQGVSGVLAVGTTGESPTLDWDEHNKVIENVHEYIKGRRITIAGTGSNSTREALKGSLHARDIGVKAILLVDCYYNGPSSLELRKEYHGYIAERVPNVQVIPYVIPGRTGCQLLPRDLAILHKDYPNVNAVKEATGDLENMKLTRKHCGENFDILSGDDNMTHRMMASPEIKASGVVSVVSNVAPMAVQNMTMHILNGKMEEALWLLDALDPLFGIVTVKTYEDVIYEGKDYGKRLVKARNPLAYKTLMNVLGMPSGPCRQPLGKMTKAGLDKVLTAARTVYEKTPEILEPIEPFFDVKLEERLYEKRFWSGLTYG